MPRIAEETAYYLNAKVPCLALIVKAVRFPPGRWIRIADELLPPETAHELVVDLFPALRGTKVPFFAMLTDFDVWEFERELGKDAE